MRITVSARAWMLSAATGLVFLPSSHSFAESPRMLGAQRQPAAADSGTAKPGAEDDSDAVQQRLNQMYSRFGGRPAAKAKPELRESTPALAPAPREMLAKSSSKESTSGIQQASNEVAQPSSNREPGRLGEYAPSREALDNSRPARALITLPGSGLKQVSGTAERSVAQSANQSDVQRKLDELYRKNGRQMPPMQLQQLPDRELKQPLPPLPQQAARPAGQQPVAQNKVSNFFKSISPFKSSKAENDERPQKVERMSADQVRQQQQMLQSAQPRPQYPAPAIQGGTSSNLILPPLPSAPPAEGSVAAEAPRLFPPAGITPGREMPAKSNELPEFRPVVQLPPSAVVVRTVEAKIEQESALPTLSDKVSDAPFTGEIVVKKQAPTDADDPLSDDLGNAFPEVSEAEADGKPKRPQITIEKTAPPMLDQPEFVETKVEPTTDTKNDNPFTGLKLEVAPAETTESGQPPLLPSLGKSATPALRDDDDDDDDDMETDSIPADPQAAKLRKIAERSELRGFKGFCPVTLRDSRDLEDARPQFKAVFQGKVYNFASEAAREKFEKNPKLYAPAAGGNDVVASKADGADIEGTLDHAAWFRDRLYLFSNAKTKSAFEATPAKFASE